MHAKETKLPTCTNMEIKAEILENHVFGMITDTITNPEKLRECMEFFKRRAQATLLRLEKQLKIVELKTKKVIEAKKRMLDLYTSGEIERDAYVLKNLEYDNELNKLKIERTQWIAQIPLLHKKEIVDVSIKQYCETAKIRFEKCTDFETKRQFLLDYVGKIVYWNEKVEFHGNVPVQLKVYEDRQQKTELAKLEFCIKDTIKRMERLGRHNRKPNFDMQITRKEFDTLLQRHKDWTKFKGNRTNQTESTHCNDPYSQED